jgi:hypothetical protein
VSSQEFGVIVGAFANELTSSGEHTVAEALGHDRRHPLVFLLRDALGDRATDGARLNETIVRFKLVMDSCLDYGSVRMLRALGLMHPEKFTILELCVLAGVGGVTVTVCVWRVCVRECSMLP